MGDPGTCVALLDRDGIVLRLGGGLQMLPPAGGSAYGALAEAAREPVRRALADGRDVTLTTRANGVPVALHLIGVRGRAVAGVLRLSSLAREHELEEALGQAQRLHEVGELAGGIAHDFNNLLTAILGAVEDLTAHAAEGDREDLAQIRSSAGRGAELVRQLLAFGQRQTLQPRVLVLDEAVAEAARLLRQLIGSHISLVLDLQAPARRVLMDATQLDQVLVNLAVNARNAMGDGGTLRIATGWRMVLADDADMGDGLPPGRYATIEVCDTGGGIPQDVLPRIFDPFFTTRRGKGGTGLGLSMVQGIVAQSGGTIGVDSVLGEGTRFCITLPRYEGPADMAVARAPEVIAVAAPRPVAGGKAELPPAGAVQVGRVLLVDDDDAIRRLAKRTLSRAGWSVIEADGAEAALAVDLAGIDCVVSDVSMPGMDGPSLVRILRERRANLPALLISGYADAGQRRALAGEDIAFLAKPFAMGELSGVVARLLPPLVGAALAEAK